MLNWRRPDVRRRDEPVDGEGAGWHPATVAKASPRSAPFPVPPHNGPAHDTITRKSRQSRRASPRTPLGSSGRRLPFVRMSVVIAAGKEATNAEAASRPGKRW
jgi:hypothetical protein